MMAIELVKTLFALVAVLGLMFGVVVVMKKFFLIHRPTKYTTNKIIKRT